MFCHIFHYYDHDEFLLFGMTQAPPYLQDSFGRYQGGITLL